MEFATVQMNDTPLIVYTKTTINRILNFDGTHVTYVELSAPTIDELQKFAQRNGYGPLDKNGEFKVKLKGAVMRNGLIIDPEDIRHEACLLQLKFIAWKRDEAKGISIQSRHVECLA